MQCKWNLVAMSLSGIVASSNTGCQTSANVTFTPRELAVTPLVPLRTGPLAQDFRSGASYNKVGSHLFTVFGIEVLDVKTKQIVSEQVEVAICETLKSAGYDPVPVTNGHGLIMKGKLLHLHFWNYTWLYPILIMGGSVELQLSLHDENDRVVWTRHFERSSGFPNLLFGGGFETMIRLALNKVLDDIARECRTTEFQRVLGGGGGGGAGTGGGPGRIGGSPIGSILFESAPVLERVKVVTGNGGNGGQGGAGGRGMPGGNGGASGGGGTAQATGGGHGGKRWSRRNRT